jgi:hypothetical protein
MVDRRRYTGTKQLQTGWTALVLVAVALVLGPLSTLLPDVSLPVWVGVGSVLWVVGLVALGLRDRRHWNRMVERSSFEHHRGTRRADLEKLYRGRSVTVTTAIPGVLAGTHLQARTAVENVDAEFTVELERVESDGSDRGLTTGNESLDERFVISGREGNVARLLSPDVQAALMDLETRGTLTVTGTDVVYDVPFTRLSGDELEAIATVVVEFAERVEAVAGA